MASPSQSRPQSGGRGWREDSGELAVGSVSEGTAGRGPRDLHWQDPQSGFPGLGVREEEDQRAPPAGLGTSASPHSTLLLWTHRLSCMRTHVHTDTPAQGRMHAECTHAHLCEAGLRQPLGQAQWRLWLRPGAQRARRGLPRTQPPTLTLQCWPVVARSPAAKGAASGLQGHENGRSSPSQPSVSGEITPQSSAGAIRLLRLGRNEALTGGGGAAPSQG